MESKITPWVVSGKIDYMELVNNFGTQLITKELQDRFERVTGRELHPWIKRGIFFSHRDLDKFLDAYENGEAIFLYTGRGPSSNAMHLGHMIPFTLTKWLQDIFDCPLIIQIADDEKYYFKDLDFCDVEKLASNNIKDIISIGFDPEKTFIFSNRDYRLSVKEFEIFVSEIKKMMTIKDVAKIFGFGRTVKSVMENGEMKEEYVLSDVNIGMIEWPLYQTAAAFSQSYPHIFGDRIAHCMVVYAIDQDNYFRMARDIAPKMNLLKPCSIMSTFLDPLDGPNGKMSSSTSSDATIFLTDNPETIKRKINTYAFSGGGGNGSLSDHRKYGGNTDIDIPCKFLRYFEYDDDNLDHIYTEFRKGNLTCSDTKNILVDIVTKIILEHQERFSLVNDETVKKFYSHKKITLPEPKKRELVPAEKKLYDLFDMFDIKYETIYHVPVSTLEEKKYIAKKMRGIYTKETFLVGEEKYLYISDINSEINLKMLCKKTGEKKLRCLDKTRELCDKDSGQIGLLFLVRNNKENICVLLDNGLRNMRVNICPSRNDATTSLMCSDIEKFLDYNESRYAFV